MSGRKLTPETRAEVVAALLAGTAAIIEHRKQKRADPATIRPTPYRHGDPTQLRSRPRQLLVDIADDPVEASLRRTVRSVGQYLHEIGGTALMIDVVESSEIGGWPLDIISHAWDGIGDWFA